MHDPSHNVIAVNSVRQQLLRKEMPASEQYQATGVKVSSIEWSRFKTHDSI